MLRRTVASRAELEKSKRSGLADIRDSLTFFLHIYMYRKKGVYTRELECGQYEGWVISRECSQLPRERTGFRWISVEARG